MSPQSALSSDGKVSVLISTYCRSHYLIRSIESALNQTYENIEIIVVDDGSTDDTAEVCAAFTEKIKYIYQENGGLGSSRQTALANATGEYIAWLDDDDRWVPEKLEKIVMYISGNSIGADTN